ncbi:hypothetical protein F4678DRAFT_428191 [Xylaria arbuscula]|nr:hypothetical protein F4678DRAFT_428191 [Xylaria arbuscula]
MASAQAGMALRRIVTTTKSNQSVILIDDEIHPFPGFAANAATIWKNHKYPAELVDSDPAKEGLEMYTQGSLIRVVDFPPNSQGHNHRTSSLDYGIVLDGELELHLEDGSCTIVRPGDVVVQQATMHQWNNNTNKPIRVLFILLPSEKPDVDGVEVGESGIPEKFRPET